MRGWRGPTVQLSVLDVSRHLESAYRWFNDPEVLEHLGAGPFPYSRVQEEEFFAEMARSRTDVVFAIERLSDGEYLGNSGLHGINLVSRVATSGSFIAERENRGKGYGVEAGHIRALYAFEVLNLRMVMSCYHGGNEASRRMQERLGYVEVGRVPERYWKHGQYVDEVMMCLRRERWREIAPDWVYELNAVSQISSTPGADRRDQ